MKANTEQWEFEKISEILAKAYGPLQQKRMHEKSKYYNKLYVTFNNHYIKEQIRDSVIKEGSLINEGHLKTLQPIEGTTKSVSH